MTTSGSPPKIALAGLGLWIIGFVLGGVGNSDPSFLWMTIPGDALITVGTVLAIAGAVSAGTSVLQITSVGILLGFGIFYVGEPHQTHVDSGIGLGFEHDIHVYIGLGLWAAATVIAALLAIHHTRKLHASRSGDATRVF